MDGKHERDERGLIVCPEEFEGDSTVDIREIRCPHFDFPLRYERIPTLEPNYWEQP